MPLNTQPLSPARRAILLATLLALFAASLGFAQLLIHRHPSAPAPDSRHELTVDWNLPKEFTFLPRNPNEAPEIKFRAVVSPANHPRQLLGIIADLDPRSTAQSNLKNAQDFFAEFFNTNPSLHCLASIAHRVGVELEAVDNPHFAILRMITFEGIAVIICYSGQTPITDADRALLNQIARRVELRPDSPATAK